MSPRQMFGPVDDSPLFAKLRARQDSGRGAETGARRDAAIVARCRAGEGAAGVYVTHALQRAPPDKSGPRELRIVGMRCRRLTRLKTGSPE